MHDNTNKYQKPKSLTTLLYGRIIGTSLSSKLDLLYKVLNIKINYINDYDYKYQAKITKSFNINDNEVVINKYRCYDDEFKMNYIKATMLGYYCLHLRDHCHQSYAIDNVFKTELYKRNSDLIEARQFAQELLDLLQ